MPLNYIITIDKAGSREYYDLSLFRYLLSVPNSNLNRFINNIKDEGYIGIEVDMGEIIQNENKKYNNMITAKEWTKTDPKDATILALTTRLSKLEKVNIANNELNTQRTNIMWEFKWRIIGPK